MYINPFAAGVLTTILVEVVLVLVVAVASYNKNKGRK